MADAPLPRGGTLGDSGQFDKGVLRSLDLKLKGIWNSLVAGRDPAQVQQQARTVCEEMAADNSNRKNRLLFKDWEADWEDRKELHWGLFISLDGVLAPDVKEYLHQTFRQLVRFMVDGVNDHLRRRIAEDLRGASGDYLSVRGVEIGGEMAGKGKRSTAKGEARAKVVSTLTLHHEYQDGGCLNLDPIQVNELARKADVAGSTVSTFFKKEFGGHKKYMVVCRDADRLVESLKVLNGDFAPMKLYGRRPPDEDDRDKDD